MTVLSQLYVVNLSMATSLLKRGHIFSANLDSELLDAVLFSRDQLACFEVQHTIFHFLVIPCGLEWIEGHVVGKKENLLLQIIGCDAVEWSPSTICNLVCAKAPTTGQLLMCWLENEVVGFFFSGKGFLSQLGYICECLLCWWPVCLRCTLRCCLRCRKIRWWWLCIEIIIQTKVQV